MCRLYGFQASEPTKVECSLVHAQDALMAQSRADSEGKSHGHGWGVATYGNGLPHVDKQAWAAYHGEHFRKSAARAYSNTVIAHIRRATVGPPGLDNTHPFVHGRWVFAHNGTLPNFDLVRDAMIDAVDPLHRSEIKGDTDSEFIFRYLLSLWEHEPGRPLIDTLNLGLERVIAWCRDIDRNAKIGLNVLWSDGDHLLGSRFGRSLWYLERDRIHTCGICGGAHVHHLADQDYRAVEIASQPVTEEEWLQVPNGTVFNVDPDMRMHIKPLGPADSFGAAPRRHADGIK